MKRPAGNDLRVVRRRQKLDAFAQTLRTSARSFEEVVEAMISAASEYLEAIESDPIGLEVSSRIADEQLTREQAAKRLGLDPTTLTRLVDNRKIAVIRYPGAKGERDIVRFSATVIDEFLRASTVHT